MNKAIGVLVVALLLPDTTQAAWLLWKHSLISRRLEGVPRSMGNQGDTEKWELLNALDARSECLASLREEFKKNYDGLATAYPKDRVSQSPPGSGISASLSIASQTNPAPPEKPTQLSFDYSFWCLPTGVDPRTTTMTTEKK